MNNTVRLKSWKYRILRNFIVLYTYGQIIDQSSTAQGIEAIRNIWLSVNTISKLKITRKGP